jgi:hypothetical protein
LLRSTSIEQRTGEFTTESTKIQRGLIKFGFSAVENNVMGRRIDLLLTGVTLDDNNEDFNVELSSIEVRPAPVEDAVVEMQFNKNVSTNKCLLYQQGVYSGTSKEEATDIVGLDAFIYSVYQYKDIVVAVKEAESGLFFPGDEDDFEEFLLGSSMDQLLSYVVSSINF